jgi:hypothetical protein
MHMDIDWNCNFLRRRNNNTAIEFIFNGPALILLNYVVSVTDINNTWLRIRVR